MGGERDTCEPRTEISSWSVFVSKDFDPLTGQRFRIVRVASRVETETGGHSSQVSDGQVDRMTRRGSLSYAHFAS